MLGTLRNAGICPGSDPHIDHLLPIVGRKQDHRRCFRLCAGTDLFAQLYAIHPRHHHIQDEQIGRARVQQIERMEGVIRFQDAKPPPF